MRTCYDEWVPGRRAGRGRRTSSTSEVFALWQFVIPVLTLIVGLVGGFFAGVYYLRKQLERMQSDPAMLREMAEKMGYRLNNKQMRQVQQMMKNQKRR